MHIVNATSNSFGNGIFDGWSIVIGHEYSEAVTDPDNFFAIQDGWNDAQTSENGTSARGSRRRTSRSPATSSRSSRCGATRPSTRPAGRLRRLALTQKGDDDAHAHSQGSRAAARGRGRRSWRASRPRAGATVRHDHDAEVRARASRCGTPVHRRRGHGRFAPRAADDDALLPPARRLRHRERQPASQRRRPAPTAATAAGSILDRRRLGGDVDQGAFVDYPASDGMPLALDASTQPSPARSTCELRDAPVGAAPRSTSALEALVGGQRRLGRLRLRDACSTRRRRDYPVAVHDPAERARSTGATCRGSTCASTSTARTRTAASSATRGKSFTDVPACAASFDQSVAGLGRRPVVRERRSRRASRARRGASRSRRRRSGRTRSTRGRRRASTPSATATTTFTVTK